MSQGAIQLPTTGTLPGSTAVPDMNTAYAALATLYSGSSAPTTGGTGLAGLAGVYWHDTNTNTLKIRNQADSAWIVVGTFDETDGLFEPPVAQAIGSATNDSAAAGNLGEIVESILGAGSALSLTNATAKTITSISLTAGDWDVSVAGWFNGASSTTVTQLVASISQTTNVLGSTLDSQGVISGASQTLFAGSAAQSVVVPPFRVSLGTTTTIYLVSQANFGTSTCAGYGFIRARRMR